MTKQFAYQLHVRIIFKQDRGKRMSQAVDLLSYKERMIVPAPIFIAR
jgi:hypothetical protein